MLPTHTHTQEDNIIVDHLKPKAIHECFIEYLFQRFWEIPREHPLLILIHITH